MGDLRRVVELLGNLALRSDEAGEVLAFLEDLEDGVADDQKTQAFVETLKMQIDASTRFLQAVGVRVEHIQEGRFQNVGPVAQKIGCISGSGGHQ